MATHPLWWTAQQSGFIGSNTLFLWNSLKRLSSFVVCTTFSWQSRSTKYSCRLQISLCSTHTRILTPLMWTLCVGRWRNFPPLSFLQSFVRYHCCIIVIVSTHSCYLFAVLYKRGRMQTSRRRSRKSLQLQLLCSCCRFNPSAAAQTAHLCKRHPCCCTGGWVVLHSRRGVKLPMRKYLLQGFCRGQ